MYKWFKCLVYIYFSILNGCIIVTLSFSNMARYLGEKKTSERSGVWISCLKYTRVFKAKLMSYWKITLHPSAKVLSEINATLGSLWYHSTHYFSFTLTSVSRYSCCWNNLHEGICQLLIKSYELKPPKKEAWWCFKTKKDQTTGMKNIRDSRIGRPPGYFCCMFGFF